MSLIFKTVLRRVKSINKFSFHDVWNSNSKSYVTSKITLTNTLLKIKNGPDLKDFLNDEHSMAVKATKLSAISDENQYVPYLNPSEYYGNGRKVFFDVYGCQMNVNDTEIIWSILKQNGYIKVNDIKESDVVLVITCAIREGAEEKIWNRLKHLNALKKKRSVKKGSFQIGILGCMAERLKHKLLEEERSVDLVAGPDSYKDLPRLLSITQNGQSAINVLLSLDETYADIMPVRLNHDNVTAYVSIMRGCDNMCSYCIVPFTRGRERSRPLKTIVNEVKLLAAQGIKDITLLGQNVNSYRDLSSDSERIKKTEIVSGFKTVYKPKIGGQRFDELLKCVAEVVPDVRIRFTSPHPKDFSDNVLNVIKTYPNICKSLHLPAQSGNSNVLERMRRGYTRESYIDLISHVKSFIPNVALSSDFICGFCGETDEEFADTLSLINEVKYNVAYLFAYSMREKTTAHRRYKDDISEEIKINRLKEMTNIFRKTASELQSKYVGRTELILVENTSKRLKSEMYGRNDGNIKVIIPTMEIPSSYNDFKGKTLKRKIIQPGDFICVKINESNSQVLKGEPLLHTTLSEYHTKIVDNL